MQLHANEDTAVRVAYCSIHSFFDCYTLPDALQLLQAITEAACNNKCWKKEAPDTVLFFIQNLEDLCTAATTIYYERDSRSAAVLPVPDNGVPDISRQQDYFNHNKSGAAWDFLPRHLSSKQYHDPYKAIKKFVRAMPETQWGKALRCILEFALSNNSIEGAYPFYEVLAIRKRLLQLIEACHLIEVRTTGN